MVFHYDGDVPWTGDATKSAYDTDFAALLAEVAKLTGAPVNPLQFVPHYSIESWLYLHSQRVQDIMQGGAAPQTTKGWLADNLHPENGYDHVLKPKDECPLADRFNLELADSFSVPRNLERSPSLRRTVAAWQAHSDLAKVLNLQLDPLG